MGSNPSPLEGHQRGLELHPYDHGLLRIFGLTPKLGHHGKPALAGSLIEQDLRMGEGLGVIPHLNDRAQDCVIHALGTDLRSHGRGHGAGAGAPLCVSGDLDPDGHAEPEHGRQGELASGGCGLVDATALAPTPLGKTRWRQRMA